MKKLAINFENVLSVQSDLNKTLNETFKYMKNAGISALDVKYERFFDDPNLYSEILIAGNDSRLGRQWLRCAEITESVKGTEK